MLKIIFFDLKREIFKKREKSLNKINKRFYSILMDTNVNEKNQENGEKIEVNTNKNVKEDFIVTPWEVKGNVDYMKLINMFGTEVLDQATLDKFKRITGKELHPWLKRGIYFTHRGFNQFLDAYERGDPCFLYTGRGPSEGMHLGHLIPFMMTQWLQEILDLPCIIQLSDEEKYACKNMDFNTVYNIGMDNAKYIIACGFNQKKTFIFSNREYRLNCRAFEIFASEMKVITPSKEVRKIFGFNDETSMAMWEWPFYQFAAGFSQAYPHIFGGRPAYVLIPHAIDQDPYFRLGRDLAAKMNLLKPNNLMCTFIPPLTGTSGKMSSSVSQDSTLFLSDPEETLRRKIKQHCFSGGGGNGTLEEHNKFGGNPEIDIAYQYLRYFEHDDQKLEDIRLKFKSGEMSCGEIKEIMTEKLIPVLKNIYYKYLKVTEEELQDFLSMKPMDLPKPKKKEIEKDEQKLYTILENQGIKYETNYYEPAVTTEDKNNLEMNLQGTQINTSFLKGPGDQFFIYIYSSKTISDVKKIKKLLSVSKLRFGENDTIVEKFKCKKNAFSIFSIINDSEPANKNLKIVIDENIQKDAPVNIMPLRQDGWTKITYAEMIKFINLHKYETLYIKE
jgi:tryptophanyl-tRNA synthetase